MIPQPPLQPCDEYRRRNLQRSGQSAQDGDGRRVDPAFNLADIRAIDLRFRRQHGLRPALGETVLAEDFSEPPADQILANGRYRLLRDPHGTSSLQFFDCPVEKEVRADLQPFGNREQHRQRRLTASSFEQRGIRAGNS
jgi:hypothetical protein